MIDLVFLAGHSMIGRRVALLVDSGLMRRLFSVNGFGYIEKLTMPGWISAALA